MLDAILPSSALPNLHPAIIHFPIALAVTALLLDLAGLLLRRLTWLDLAATVLWTLAAVGAVAAVLSGDQAASGMWDVPGAAQVAMADHEQLGELTMIALLLLAGLRILLAWLARHDEQIRPRILRLLMLLAAVAVLLLLVRTADMGGSLVYHHGLGVSAAARQEATPVPAKTPAPTPSATPIATPGAPQR